MFTVESPSCCGLLKVARETMTKSHACASLRQGATQQHQHRHITEEPPPPDKFQSETGGTHKTEPANFLQRKRNQEDYFIHWSSRVPSWAENSGVRVVVAVAVISFFQDPPWRGTHPPSVHHNRVYVSEHIRRWSTSTSIITPVCACLAAPERGRSSSTCALFSLPTVHSSSASLPTDESHSRRTFRQALRGSARWNVHDSQGGMKTKTKSNTPGEWVGGT